MNWLFTVVFTAVAYTLYSVFGLRVGTSDTVVRAGLAPFTDPLNFGLVMAGTLGFSLALFFGSRASDFAFTIIIALGVVVSFAFSVVVGGASVGVYHALGIALIIAGVALLK